MSAAPPQLVDEVLRVVVREVMVVDRRLFRVCEDQVVLQIFALVGDLLLQRKPAHEAVDLHVIDLQRDLQRVHDRFFVCSRHIAVEQQRLESPV